MERPSNVGIIAADIYFPNTYVAQADLEKFDGVSQGKYTIGLGQSRMAVCSELEDINSMCLTATQQLMEKFNIPYDAVGRIEVGTETIVDKSKAVKTSLMDLFNAHNNFDVEGIDSKNACYGGTAALLNSLAWVESSAWDGRYAIVLAGDIAVYEKGNARATGGAGVVAMLVGPNAPLVVERPRATHMENVHDFYKPVMESEYPKVDGHLSNECYLRALDSCYTRYAERFEQMLNTPFSLDQAQHAVFHAPYNKLVQKSFGRYLYMDFLRGRLASPQVEQAFAPFAGMALEDTRRDKDFLNALREISKQQYKDMVAPSELITKECGNSYCGSLYAGLLSLIENRAATLQDKRILMFSYGSGLAATQFSLKVAGDVQHIKQKINVKQRLDARVAITPEEFTDILARRESTHARLDYTPQQSPSILSRGTFRLLQVDNLGRRSYIRAYSTSARVAISLCRRLRF
eukprot:m.7624 g.7624  ORF g.7624 m.7624 type:complete len:462 (-) comp4814_c0_seq1:42-1427(-)